MLVSTFPAASPAGRRGTGARAGRFLNKDFRMSVQPYLFFDGNCEAALAFYRRALGAEIVMMMRWKDSPDPAACQQNPANTDKIMHAQFRIGGSDVMGSDGNCQGQPKFEGF